MPARGAAAVNDMVAPRAVGHDAADIAGLHAKLQRDLHIFGRFGITAFAISGLDIALWDLAGKTAGVPAHRLLGGAKRTTLPCYASLLRYTEPKLVAEYCKRALDEGYDAIKLHDIRRRGRRGARGGAAPDPLDGRCELRVDAGGCDRRGAALPAARSEWLEEPVFPPENFRSLRAVGEVGGVPIAAGENFCFMTSSPRCSMRARSRSRNRRSRRSAESPSSSKSRRSPKRAASGSPRTRPTSVRVRSRRCISSPPVATRASSTSTCRPRASSSAWRSIRPAALSRCPAFRGSAPIRIPNRSAFPRT